MHCKLIAIALITLLTACAVPQRDIVIVVDKPAQPEVGDVAATLKNYEVGRTTFADLTRDSRSPLWKIYEYSENMRIVQGKTLSRTKVVVGDRSRPISILIFDPVGTLTDIAPAR